MTQVRAFPDSDHRCDGSQYAPFATLAGSLLARQSIITQHDAGVSLDQIREHQHDLAAWLFSRVSTPTGEAFSRAYAEAADSILADLAEQQARGCRRMAARLATGTPHPDTALAEKGWYVDRGVYVRHAVGGQQRVTPDPEAGRRSVHRSNTSR